MERTNGASAEFEFEPLNEFLLLRPIALDDVPADSAVSHGGHALAAWGEVVAIGVRDSIACRVSKGDRVAFRPASAVAIALAGQWFTIVGAAELLGIAGRPKELRDTTSSATISEPESQVWSEPAIVRREEEPLDTDVAPDLLDRAEPTGEDLH